MSPPGTSPLAAAETADDAANHAMRWWILAVLGVAQLMVILDNTVVNIALPTAQHALGFSNADRQWVVTAYSLAFGSLLLLGGRIGDIFGRKRTLIIGLTGIAGAGGALGLLLGGILTSYTSWRWTLYINLVFAAVAATGALLWLKNDKAASRDPLDIPGLLLVTSGLFCLVYGFSHAETTAWSNPFTIGFLVVGVVLLASFAVLERRVPYPLLPPRIVQNRTRGGSILVMLFASMGLFGVFLFLTYYLQETLKFSPVKTGIAFLPMIAALAGMAQVSNRVLLPRFGPKMTVPIGLLMNAAALYLLHRVGLHSSYVSHVLPYLLLLGLGFGLSLAPSFSTGTLGLKPSDAGVGSATLNTSQQVGGSIGTALLNTLAAGAATAYLVGRAITPANLQAAALHSYTTAFLYSSAIFVVAAVIAGLVLPRGNMRALSGPASDGASGTGTDSPPSAGVISGRTTQRPVGLRTTPASHSQR